MTGAPANARRIALVAWIVLALLATASCKATPTDLHPVGGSDEGMNLFDDD